MISNLPGKALRTLVDIARLAERFNNRSQSEPGKIDMKRRKPGILAWEFVTRSCLTVKTQNPCSNHEIHVLFEHGFHLKKPKLGPGVHA